MTRETKIGLLVGLGFIVVFAVLLSHTGQTPTDTVLPSLAQNPQTNKPVLNGDVRGEIGKPEPAPPASVEVPRTTGTSPEAEPAAPYPVEDRVVSLEDLPDLPAPTALNPSVVSEIASADNKRGDVKSENPLSILGMHRTAPEPVAPLPTVPHDPPTPSNPPTTPDAVKVAAGNTTPSNAGAVAAAAGNKTAPSVTPAKEYTVQSKDNLVKIAQKNYKSSDPKVIDALVKANEGRIKNANSIVEGQTLLIPDLPPEMFERVGDVRLAGARMSMEDVLNDRARKAPTGSPSSAVLPNPTATKTKEAGSKETPAKPAKADSKETAAKPTKADEPKSKPLIEQPKALVDEPKALTTTDQPKSKATVTNSKPVEDSATRLSLSGFVPVRITPNVDSKEVKPEPKPDSTKTPSGSALKPVKDNTDSKSTKKDSARDAKETKDSKDSKESKDRAATKDKDNSGQGDQLNRWYEIKANDTMGSIARKELGSSQHWQEIKKLNNGLDPQKMKPGDRIKLPRKPVSQSSGNGRASA